jgi:hypothetical protein
MSKGFMLKNVLRLFATSSFFAGVLFGAQGAFSQQQAPLEWPLIPTPREVVPLLSSMPRLPRHICGDPPHSSEKPGTVEQRLEMKRYNRCIKSVEASNELYRKWQQKEEVAQWKKYGNVEVSWSSWKAPQKNVRTARARSRCWFREGSNWDVRYVDYANGSCEGNTEYATIALHCGYLKTSFLGDMWKSWGEWVAPVKGSPEEKLLINICSLVQSE